MTHICVGKLTIIGSDNGLSPGRRQAIIWTNAGILLIGPLGTNFSEILIAIEAFTFKKMHLKITSAKWWPFCLGLNVLNRNSCADKMISCSVILPDDTKPLRKPKLISKIHGTNMFWKSWSVSCQLPCFCEKYIFCLFCCGIVIAEWIFVIH